ncbi:MAG: diflavin oxidoreductase [Verrucomicrobiota bacterium]
MSGEIECKYSRNRPYQATLKSSVRINGEASGKETRHLVFALEEDELEFSPGDALGVFPKNQPELVEGVLRALKLKGESPIQKTDGFRTTLKDELSTRYVLNRVGKKFVKGVAKKFQIQTLCALDETQLDEYIYTRDCLDVFKEYPQIQMTAEEFLELLTPIVPRLYSISSSWSRHPHEAHVTLAVVEYETHGRHRYGLCSGYMGKFLSVGQSAPVYIQRSRHFHLPPDSRTDIIMAGPGTGVAPFLSFLQQRQMEKAQGRSWLFFGDRYEKTDFLYRNQIEDWQRQGALTRLSLAWSRDQEHKIYVQDRLRENSAELWEWIKNGAWFYVCGDAKRMAKDVHQALIDMAIKKGQLSQKQAEEYVNTTMMKTEKRYRRDVY